jgi:hypothetical protein
MYYSSDDEISQVCVPNDNVLHRPRSPNHGKKDVVIPNEDNDDQFCISNSEDNDGYTSRLIQVPCDTWYEEDLDEQMGFFEDGGNNFVDGVSWEMDVHPVGEEKGLLVRGIRVEGRPKGKLIGMDVNQSLFEGSPYSARDLCRYLLCLKHSTSKLPSLCLHLDLVLTPYIILPSF